MPTARAPSLAASTFLALLACAPPPGVEVEDVRVLVDHVSASRRAEHRELRERAQELACTDEALALRLGEPLRFPRVDLPRSFRLELQVAGVEPANARELELVVRAELDGGTVETLDVPVALFDADGRHLPGPIPVEVEAAVGEPVRSLELELSSSASGRAVLLRPRAYHRRAIPARSGARRQVVFVTLDTLRADHLGCHGDERGLTPAIDALAGDAVRFDEAISASNVTNPSHASMFTGLFVGDHGVEGNHHRFDVTIPTLPRRLADEGFATAAFTAASFFGASGTGLARLFDDFGTAVAHRERRAGDVNADAVPWLNEHAREDFFLWLHYFDAHAPYEPPRAWRSSLESDDETQRLAQRYADEVRYLDHELGALLDHLRALEILDDALVVVTADHGESLGEHGIEFEHHGLYEPTVRVPLLVKPPGSGPAGVVQGPVSAVDLFPTILALLDLEPYADLRGRSLVPAIDAARASAEPVRIAAAPVFAEHSNRQQVCVRTEARKLVLGRVDKQYSSTFSTRSGSVELFDLEADPEELDDVAPRRPDETSELRRLVEAFLADSRGHRAAEITDPEFLDELRQLGYTE